MLKAGKSWEKVIWERSYLSRSCKCFISIKWFQIKKANIYLPLLKLDNACTIFSLLWYSLYPCFGVFLDSLTPWFLCKEPGVICVETVLLTFLLCLVFLPKNLCISLWANSLLYFSGCFTVSRLNFKHSVLAYFTVRNVGFSCTVPTIGSQYLFWASQKRSF